MPKRLLEESKQEGKKNKVEISYWNDVPKDITNYIFSYLDLPNVLNSSLVCKNWLILIRNGNYKITITKISGLKLFPNTTHLTLKGIQLLKPHHLNKYDQLKKITLVDCHFVSDFKFVTPKLEKIVYLKHRRACSSHKNLSKLLQAIKESPNIKSLHISYPKNKYSGNGLGGDLKFLREYLGNIEKLKLENFDLTTSYDKSTELPKLKKLVLKYSRLMHMTQDEILKLTESNIHHIKIVDEPIVHSRKICLTCEFKKHGKILEYLHDLHDQEI